MLRKKRDKKRDQERDTERERAFYENGSKLHEKLIASCNGRPIPIRSYSCEELQGATNNFDRSRIFHTDGLYEWYNGSFEGRMISIKKHLQHRGDDIFTDIAVSAKMSTHNNVLKLIGCCLEAQIPISVYESAANGSLSGRVYDVTSDRDGAQQHQREPLSWQSRLKIAREIAHAISYLHTAFSRPIVHRDIKSGNVFLDQNDVAKLTDFSWSILIPEERFTINEVVDPAILVGEEGSVVWQQLEAVLPLALICRKKDPEIRPNMVDVTKELRKIERFIL
uniref:Protein kinase domain-containing protein n=1 Tax=Quercus lobata TaxID=97700 RepID=A0A7N2R611_QUELO